jgi:uncharacterized protein (DUF58 family)
MIRQVITGRLLATSWIFSAFLALVSAVLLAVAGCHRSGRPEPEIRVDREITPQPVRVGPATVTVHLTDAAKKPVSRATIKVEADMSHPGMSPVFGEAEETAPGSYQAHLDLNMGGDWVVLLHIKLSDARQIERKMDVRVVQSN